MAGKDIDILSIIDKILWGKSIVKIPTSIGDKIFILRSLSIKESNLSKHIRANAFDEGVSMGLMTHEELTNFYRITGDWDQDKDHEIERLKSEVKQLQGSLARAEFMTHRKKSIAKQLDDKESQLIEMQHRKSSLFSNSAESRADEIQRRYIVMWSTEDMNEKPYWGTEDDFLNESDHDLIYKLAIAYFENNLFSESILRKVARSGAWRYRWKMAKNGADIFGKPVAEWSEMQNLIVYWSQVYDYVYESGDRPGEHIIENDALCDGWLEEQNRKAGVSTTQKTEGRNYNMFGTKTAKQNKRHQEHFIMVQPGDQESVKKVQSMNSPQVRERLRRENQIIKEKGKIKEFDLRKGVLPNGERVPINVRQKK